MGQGKECVAMILAGGQGSRLYVLTTKVAKPAVPFGGKYRIIDFPLSNCTNSDIDTVGVLTQYRPQELNAYIGNGQPWDLDRENGGVHVLQPYMTGSTGEWYKGTANAIYQNMDFIEQYDPKYVVILGGDHIYRMDYSKMLDQHKSHNAAATIAVLEVEWEEASRFGIMSVDENDNIIEFAEKPKEPESNLASMGIYIFTWEKLRDYLTRDEADPNSKNDFGGDIIPAMIAAGETVVAHRFDGYWKDVGTINSLWDANMDMLINPQLDAFGANWKIYTRNPTAPPHYISREAHVEHSIIPEGCEIYGRVENSVLFHSVTVEKGAVVRYSAVMPGVVIDEGAVVEYAIVAEGAHIHAGAHVGGDPQSVDPDKWGIAVVASDVNIGKNAVVSAGAMIDKDIEAKEGK